MIKIWKSIDRTRIWKLLNTKSISWMTYSSSLRRDFTKLRRKEKKKNLHYLILNRYSASSTHKRRRFQWSKSRIRNLILWDTDVFKVLTNVFLLRNYKKNRIDNQYCSSEKKKYKCINKWMASILNILSKDLMKFILKATTFWRRIRKQEMEK